MQFINNENIVGLIEITHTIKERTWWLCTTLVFKRTVFRSQTPSTTSYSCCLWRPFCEIKKGSSIDPLHLGVFIIFTKSNPTAAPHNLFLTRLPAEKVLKKCQGRWSYPLNPTFLHLGCYPRDTHWCHKYTLSSTREGGRRPLSQGQFYWELL